MAETVRGGLYLGEDGRWHDAEGRVIEGARGEGRGAKPVLVDGVDDMDAVDGEAKSAAPAPAAAGKKRGK